MDFFEKLTSLAAKGSIVVPGYFKQKRPFINMVLGYLIHWK